MAEMKNNVKLWVSVSAANLDPIFKYELNKHATMGKTNIAVSRQMNHNTALEAQKKEN
jgi:hypothetical protein